MWRMVLVLAGVLLALVALGSDAPREYDGRAQVLNPLLGKWRPRKFETITGMSSSAGISPAWVEEAAVVFTENGYTWDWEGEYNGHGGTCRGTYTIYPGKVQRQLDLTDSTGPHRGVTRRCVYRIDGETLQIASTTDHPDHRPEGFEGDGTFYTLKRVKK